MYYNNSILIQQAVVESLIAFQYITYIVIIPELYICDINTVTLLCISY